MTWKEDKEEDLLLPQNHLVILPHALWLIVLGVHHMWVWSPTIFPSRSHLCSHLSKRATALKKLASYLGTVGQICPYQRYWECNPETLLSAAEPPALPLPQNPLLSTSHTFLNCQHYYLTHSGMGQIQWWWACGAVSYLCSDSNVLSCCTSFVVLLRPLQEQILRSTIP